MSGKEEVVRKVKKGMLSEEMVTEVSEDDD